MRQSRKLYPSDLTDLQWKHIRIFIPKPRHGGRPRTTDVRLVINAIFYLCRTGCSWRYLPAQFPPWQTVYEYFSKWSHSGVLEKIHHLIRDKIRFKTGKKSFTRVLIIDSQSVKAHYGEDRGYDGFKKVRGRKRHIFVDTSGLIHALQVGSADLNDGFEGCLLFERLSKEQLKQLLHIHADHGYRGSFAEYTNDLLNFYPQLPEKRVNSGQGVYKMIKEKKKKLRGMAPRRWIVERTFAWFVHFGRLHRDRERRTRNSESMIYIAMIQLMLKRLSKLFLLWTFQTASAEAALI